MIFSLYDCRRLGTAVCMSQAENPPAHAQDLVQLHSDLSKLTQQTPYASGETTLVVLQRVDQFAATAQCDAMLQHYLERRSYQKAFDWFADPQQPHQM